MACAPRSSATPRGISWRSTRFPTNCERNSNGRSGPGNLTWRTHEPLVPWLLCLGTLEERSAEEPLLDRGDHLGSVGLLFVEQRVAEGTPQLAFELRGVSHPSASGLEEIRGHIGRHDLGESGRLEEFGLFP